LPTGGAMGRDRGHRGRRLRGDRRVRPGPSRRSTAPGSVRWCPRRGPRSTPIWSFGRGGGSAGSAGLKRGRHAFHSALDGADGWPSSRTVLGGLTFPGRALLADRVQCDRCRGRVHGAEHPRSTGCGRVPPGPSNSPTGVAAPTHGPWRHPVPGTRPGRSPIQPGPNRPSTANQCFAVTLAPRPRRATTNASRGDANCGRSAFRSTGPHCFDGPAAPQPFQLPSYALPATAVLAPSRDSLSGERDRGSGWSGPGYPLLGAGGCRLAGGEGVCC